MTNLSFNSDPELKARYLEQLEAHAAADEIVQGQYWENGKGCAIGCLVHGHGHEELARMLDIPEGILRLVDRLFESLPNAEAKTFAVEWFRDVPVGADLSLVTNKFLVSVLKRNLELPVVRENTVVREVTEQVIALHERVIAGEVVSRGEWQAARAAARATESVAAARAAARAAAWTEAWAAWTAWNADAHYNPTGDAGVSWYPMP